MPKPRPATLTPRQFPTREPPSPTYSEHLTNQTLQATFFFELGTREPLSAAPADSMRGPDEKISSMVLSHGGRAMPMFSLRYIVAHQHGRPVGISHGELQNTSAWRVRPGSKRHLATAVYPRLKHLRTHKTIVTCVISNGKFFTSIHCFSSSDRLCKSSLQVSTVFPLRTAFASSRRLSAPDHLPYS